MVALGENAAPTAAKLQVSIEHQSPRQGWMRPLPAFTIPYLQLMRLDRFNGYWYFWLPHFYGVTIGAKVQQFSLFQFIHINILLLWGVLIMRGATCTWNDTVDAPFDRLVSRTRNRPVARGAVSVWRAHSFTALQTLVSLLNLALLPPVSFIYAIPAIVGWFCYPLAKRVTYYPQVVLGFPMAWGIFMGAAATGLDPLNLEPLLHAVQDQANFIEAWKEVEVRSPHLFYIYAANVLWTLLYETVYSHQDAPEDIAAGVKNIVLLYADTSGPQIKFKTKPLLVKLAVAQVSLLFYAGWVNSSGFIYFLGTVVGTAISSAVLVIDVDLHNGPNCAWWFKVGCLFTTGGAMAIGLLGEYVGEMIFQSM